MGDSKGLNRGKIVPSKNDAAFRDFSYYIVMTYIRFKNRGFFSAIKSEDLTPEE